MSEDQQPTVITGAPGNKYGPAVWETLSGIVDGLKELEARYDALRKTFTAEYEPKYFRAMELEHATATRAEKERAYRLQVEPSLPEAEASQAESQERIEAGPSW